MTRNPAMNTGSGEWGVGSSEVLDSLFLDAFAFPPDGLSLDPGKGFGGERFDSLPFPTPCSPSGAKRSASLLPGSEATPSEAT